MRTVAYVSNYAFHNCLMGGKLRVGTREDFDEAFKLGIAFSESWISVEDENPDYYTPVIVDAYGGIIAWRAWSETHGDVYTISGTNIVLKETPKRWRPLNMK